MKNYSFFFFLILISQFVLGQTVKTQVLFDKDSFNLNQPAKQKLGKVCLDILNTKKDFELVLTGHTDSDGSQEYNDLLSKKRTEAVTAFLVDKGIARDKIKVEYFGELHPKVDNVDEAAMAVNRRVELTISYLKPLVIPKPEVVVIADTPPAINRCLTDTILKLPKGTTLRMSICDFEKNRVALLSSYELTTMDDILESDLSFRTDRGDDLITGGMIKIGDEDTEFEYPVTVTMPLIPNFYACNDSAILERMRLYRANHSGDWADSDSVNVGFVGNTTTFTFTVLSGGFFNCDAIGFAPVRVLAQAGSALFSPIAKYLQEKRNTLKIKAPKGEKFSSVRIATQCVSCSQPTIITNKSVSYNKSRTKAKIKLGCCLSDQVKVNYKLKKRKGRKTVELQDMKKIGGKKLANCGSSAGVLAAIRRAFKPLPKVYRNYRIKES